MQNKEKKFTLRYSIQSKTVRTFLKATRRKGSWPLEEEQLRLAADMAVASVEGRLTMERCPQSTKRK